TVGAGDTLVAGMCWGELNQWPRKQTLGFATALSALAVTQVNVGIENMNDVDALKAQVSVKQITNEKEQG
ncbi:PfkB family carbohydrate kinase, partial [Enterovibrio norvegicus]|uniref:PfkB family carbohydrate kinase n=1 Tax=Enterovibrio norvegicus TaxID=188144 RepID=UPI0005597E18